MKYKVIIKELKNLTANEYAACYRLNFRQDGAMQEVLSHYRAAYKDESDIEYIANCRIYMVGSSNKLLGWGILFPSNWIPSKDGSYNFYVYVRQSYRRSGIASSIFESVYKDYSTLDYYKNSCSLIVYPHDEKSRAFYTKFITKNNSKLNRVSIRDYGNV